VAREKTRHTIEIHLTAAGAAERRGFAESIGEEKRMRRVEEALVLSSSLRDLCVLRRQRR
jgi:hypothetical protein